MNPLLPMWALVQNELRVRTRRLSTLVCLALLVVVTWAVVVDPASGRAMIVLKGQMVAYSSLVLALGTSVMANFAFGLFGFYFVRGRTREDLQYGLGTVLGASPITNTMFLVSRWLGAMAYLLSFLVVIALTMMVMQYLIGFGKVEPLTFLGTYLLFMLPTFALASSVAVLADSHARLMGKGGDVLYLGLWIAQFGALPSMVMNRSIDISWASVFDVSGIASLVMRMRQITEGGDSFAVGGSSYDPNLPALVLGDFWTLELVFARLACVALAMTPLVLAVLVFHRYSPDKVKPVIGHSRIGLWSAINRLLLPVRTLIAPLYVLASRRAGLTGQVIAEIASTLTANPVLVLVAATLMLAGCMVSAESTRGLLLATVAVWGVMVSDIAARDLQSATVAMTSVVPGGRAGRLLRLVLAALALGLLVTLPISTRLLLSAPGTCLTLVVGLVFLSVVCVFLGQLIGSGRAFLALFLFWLYLAKNLPIFKWLDVVGFNGLADSTTVAGFALAALVVMLSGVVHTASRD